MSCGDLRPSQLFTHWMMVFIPFGTILIRLKRIEFDLVFQNYANTPTFSWGVVLHCFCFKFSNNSGSEGRSTSLVSTNLATPQSRSRSQSQS